MKSSKVSVITFNRKFVVIVKCLLLAYSEAILFAIKTKKKCYMTRIVSVST